MEEATFQAWVAARRPGGVDATLATPVTTAIKDACAMLRVNHRSMKSCIKWYAKRDQQAHAKCLWI